MRFDIILYEGADGTSPVLEFLEELKKSDPKEYPRLLAKIARLRDGRNHGEPLTKPIGDGLFELRHLGVLNTRLLWFFRSGCRIIVVHGIRNKAQRIEPVDLRTALKRMADWKARHSDG